MPTSQDAQRLPETAVGIVGVGLIGGSIAAGLRKHGYPGRIVGIGRDTARLRAARAAGLIDAGGTDFSALPDGEVLVVFCTPVDLIAEGVRSAARVCRPGTLLTDVGSVKASICEALSGGLPEGITFIGSHPLAGSEKRGFEHADAELFEERVTVITPDDPTPAEELQRLRGFWESLGSTVLELPAEEHDRALAETSHLPHVVAAALAATLSDSNEPLAATGFRDTTRIAAGDPGLWVTILLENADEVGRSIDRYGELLADYREAIANRDADELHRLLETAKERRDKL